MSEATAESLMPASSSSFSSRWTSRERSRVIAVRARVRSRSCRIGSGGELPKVITRKARTLTPGEYQRLLAALPAQHRLMVETLIEAGLRWGELVALKPRHIDFLRRTLAVEETIVEVSKKHSPTGQRYLIKPYPKDNEPRTFGVRQAWLDNAADHIRVNGIGHDDLLFPTRAGTPISRNTFRTRIWLPAVNSSGIDFPVRVHDLRHAHASWLLAGGPISSQSWTAWATPRSKPHRSTSTRCPTQTNATSTPSAKSRTRRSQPHPGSTV